MTDLPAAVFLVLRNEFFLAGAAPKPYRLRDKRNTQDDPFDEHVQDVLSHQLPNDTYALPAPGPLITPDLVVLRPEDCEASRRADLRSDPARIVGIEVKKLERQKGGAVARASGMDYNTTPPCGTVRVYDRDARALDIKGFYLFVCQEPTQDSPPQYQLSALVLCDGDMLNADFDLYLSIVGERTKRTGLGSYKDGADRNRPMLIFANPLGTPLLNRHATLVHARDDLQTQFPTLSRIGIIRRTIPGVGSAAFYCYRIAADVPAGHVPFDVVDPFPTPERTDRTQARGRFRVEILPRE
jgi:hypothetical protein